MAKAVENTDPYAGLNAYWRKFFNKFDDIDDPTFKVSKWKEVHILAYICKRYEQLFNKKFAVTIKGAPGKSPDIYMVKTIIASLNTSNNNIVKEYIDWVYDTKIVPKKVKFRRIGFFVTSGFANEFLDTRANKRKKMSKSLELPGSYVEIAKDLGITVKTYGDLAFIKMSLDRNSDDKSSPYYVLISNLELLGLDMQQLKEMV